MQGQATRTKLSYHRAARKSGWKHFLYGSGKPFRQHFESRRMVDKVGSNVILDPEFDSLFEPCVVLQLDPNVMHEVFGRFGG